MLSRYRRVGDYGSGLAVAVPPLLLTLALMVVLGLLSRVAPLPQSMQSVAFPGAIFLLLFVGFYLRARVPQKERPRRLLPARSRVRLQRPETKA